MNMMQRVLSNNSTRQYVIHPPWQDHRDRNTGVVRYRRYSCAGFVLDAYEQIGIPLLETEEQSLPEVTSEAVEAAYPKPFENPGLLPRFGLQGNGPWRVVLAGYVLHALDRSKADIREKPYPAQEGDEIFRKPPKESISARGPGREHEDRSACVKRIAGAFLGACGQRSLGRGLRARLIV